jgi:hypothetical protein
MMGILLINRKKTATIKKNIFPTAAKTCNILKKKITPRYPKYPKVKLSITEETTEKILYPIFITIDKGISIL